MSSRQRRWPRRWRPPLPPPPPPPASGCCWPAPTSPVTRWQPPSAPRREGQRDRHLPHAPPRLSAPLGNRRAAKRSRELDHVHLVVNSGELRRVGPAQRDRRRPHRPRRPGRYRPSDRRHASPPGLRPDPRRAATHDRRARPGDGAKDCYEDGRRLNRNPSADNWLSKATSFHPHRILSRGRGVRSFASTYGSGQAGCRGGWPIHECPGILQEVGNGRYWRTQPGRRSMGSASRSFRWMLLIELEIAAVIFSAMSSLLPLPLLLLPRRGLRF